MKSTIVISGVSGGLGGALAQSLKRRGDSVIGTARNPATANAPFPIMPLDLSSDESIRRFSAGIVQPVDVLINNSGIATVNPGAGRAEEPFKRLSRREFAQILDVNVIGTFLLTQALLDQLGRGRCKTIINISSELGSIAGNTSGERYAYRCSKAALNMLTRTLAADLGPRGFICIAWSPGWVRTAMGGDDAPLSPEESADALADFLPRITPEHNGLFLDQHGRPLQW